MQNSVPNGCSAHTGDVTALLTQRWGPATLTAISDVCGKQTRPKPLERKGKWQGQ